MFTYPGWHYRGFPAIPVCDACAAQIRQGHSVTFLYQQVTYRYDGTTQDVYVDGENTSCCMVQ
jgi:hypothetical protein